MYNKQMRLSQVDTAKFFAIYCVLISHSGISDIYSLLYAFHVQLFFILSGFTYKPKETGVKELLSNKLPKLFKRIYVPYLLLAFILGAPLNLHCLLRVLYGSDQMVSHITAPYLWFLPCFFCATVVYSLLRIVLRQKEVYVVAIVAIFAFIASLWDFESKVYIELLDRKLYLTGWSDSCKSFEKYVGFPLDLNIALSGVVFMYIGTVLRKVYDNYLLYTHRSFLILSTFIFAIIGWYSYVVNLNHIPWGGWNYPTTAISWAAYGNYLLFMSSSVFLGLCVLNTSCLCDNKIFAYYGKYTFAIYALHGIVLECIFSVLKRIDILEYTSNITYVVIIGTLTLVGTILIIPIFRYLDKTLIGE